MRCLTCGAEMNLMKVVVDNTMMVPGFERHTFMCSGCYGIERRFVFNKGCEAYESATASPPIAPISAKFGSLDMGDDTDTAAPSHAAGSIQNDQLIAIRYWLDRFFAKIRTPRSRSDA